MGLQVEIIVHGVPAGHKLLGTTDERISNYIRTFYNQNEWNVPEYMKVEKVGANVFYSLIVCNNVSALDGRPGSYFGLTLQMNAYYIDIQNIYAILKAAYKKFCIGAYIKVTGKNVQFLVSDFKERSNQYDDICKMVVNAISNFASNQDIINLNKIPQSNGAPVSVNFDECNANLSMQLIASSGTFKVSPYYPSQESQRLKNECKQRVNQVKQESAIKTSQLQKSHQEDMTRLQDQYRQQLQDFQRKEQELQGGRKGLQRTIDELQQQLKSLRTQSQQQIDDLKAKLHQQQKAKIEILQSLKIIFDNYSNGLDRQFNALDRRKLPIEKESNETKQKKLSPWEYFIKRYLLGTVIILILIASNGLWYMQNSAISKTFANQSERVALLDSTIQTMNAPIVSDNVANNTDYDGLEIVIKGLIHKKIVKGKRINLSLRDKDDSMVNDLNGKWEASGIEVTSLPNGGGSLKVPNDYKESKLNIKYIINGGVVTERDVDIKQ